MLLQGLKIMLERRKVQRSTVGPIPSRESRVETAEAAARRTTKNRMQVEGAPRLDMTKVHHVAAFPFLVD